MDNVGEFNPHLPLCKVSIPQKLNRTLKGRRLITRDIHSYFRTMLVSINTNNISIIHTIDKFLNTTCVVNEDKSSRMLNNHYEWRVTNSKQN